MNDTDYANIRPPQIAQPNPTPELSQRTNSSAAADRKRLLRLKLGSADNIRQCAGAQNNVV